ncbi:MAG: hypothetical protein PHV43_01990 [Candidatus Colwellbacteria bacterium]|nr:hypothetical protein [Candidatus Colwellbacteria bacterium]
MTRFNRDFSGFSSSAKILGPKGFAEGNMLTGIVNFELGQVPGAVLSKTSKLDKLTLTAPSVPRDKFIEELLELNSVSERFLLIDTNIDTRRLKGFEDVTRITSGVVTEKEGYYFRNASSKDYITNFSVTRDDFKKEAGGTLTVSAFDQSAILAYNTRADTISCAGCNAPTTSTLTNCRGDVFYVCQHLSSVDFCLLVLTAAFSCFLLLTDERCLGWSSKTAGSVSLEKGVSWSDYYHV